MHELVQRSSCEVTGPIFIGVQLVREGVFSLDIILAGPVQASNISLGCGVEHLDVRMLLVPLRHDPVHVSIIFVGFSEAIVTTSHQISGVSTLVREVIIEIILNVVQFVLDSATAHVVLVSGKGVVEAVKIVGVIFLHECIQN